MDNSNSYRLAVELRDRLLADLRQNRTFVAYQHAEAVILALSVDAEQTKPAAQKNSVNPDKNVRQSFKPGTVSAGILTGALQYLREKKGRAQSGEILQALRDRAIKVTGNRPSSTVSSYLSHSALFDNKPGQGYGLTEWSRSQTETPNSSELFGAPRNNGALPLNP